MDGFTFAYFCIIPGKMIQHGYQEILIELECTGKLQETKSLLSACFDLALKSWTVRNCKTIPVFPRSWHRLHVFPRFKGTGPKFPCVSIVPPKCFPALTNGCSFSRSSKFPVACFLMLGNGYISSRPSPAPFASFPALQRFRLHFFLHSKPHIVFPRLAQAFPPVPWLQVCSH